MAFVEKPHSEPTNALQNWAKVIILCCTTVLLNIKPYSFPPVHDIKLFHSTAFLIQQPQHSFYCWLSVATLQFQILKDSSLFQAEAKSWRIMRHQTVRNFNIPIGLCQYIQIHSWMIQFHIWPASLLPFLILRCGDLNKPLSRSLRVWCVTRLTFVVLQTWLVFQSKRSQFLIWHTELSWALSVSPSTESKYNIYSSIHQFSYPAVFQSFLLKGGIVD